MGRVASKSNARCWEGSLRVSKEDLSLLFILSHLKSPGPVNYPGYPSPRRGAHKGRGTWHPQGTHGLWGTGIQVFAK